MKLLLDSHVLLWYDRSTALKPAVRSIVDSAESVSVSAATVWELTYKESLGKLALPSTVMRVAERYGITLLNITPEHAQVAGSLPLHHRDPFDRMLVAQAMLEGLTLVTHDRTLQQYSIPVLLA